MTESEIASQAAELELMFGAVCQGRSTAAVFVALSVFLGSAAAMAAEPDFDGFMQLIREGARASFDKERAKRNGEPDAA